MFYRSEEEASTVEWSKATVAVFLFKGALKDSEVDTQTQQGKREQVSSPSLLHSSLLYVVHKSGMWLFTWIYIMKLGKG